jgi:hypothetical protein
MATASSQVLRSSGPQSRSAFLSARNVSPASAETLLR